MLRATTACNFSSLIWLDGSAPAGRFSEPTFRPSGATHHWRNTVFRDFPTFSRICIFFLLTLSLYTLLSSDLSLLSASALLCFSSVHIVGSLTSKLPSIRMIKFSIWSILSFIECYYYKPSSQRGERGEQQFLLPVVPRKAVAEVSKIGNL